MRTSALKSFFLSISMVLVVQSCDFVCAFDAASPDTSKFANASLYSDILNSAGPIHGIAEPTKFATISAPIETTLATLSVTEGQLVQPGTVLAVMDNRVAAASVRAARVAAARSANEKLARVEVARTESRLARLQSADVGAVSDVEVEEAQAQRDRALASLTAAQEELRQASLNLEVEEAKLELHNVRAPFAGHIVRIYATVGDVLTGDEPLLEIADTSRLKAPLHLPLEWYGRLQTSRQYQLWAGPPVDRPVMGRLVYVEPRVDAASESVRCLFEIDNRQSSLPSGFSVRFDQSPSSVQDAAGQASPTPAPKPHDDTRR